MLQHSLPLDNKTIRERNRRIRYLRRQRQRDYKLNFNGLELTGNIIGQDLSYSQLLELLGTKATVVAEE